MSSSSPNKNKRLTLSSPGAVVIVGIFAMFFAAVVVTIPPHTSFAQVAPVNPRGGNNTITTPFSPEAITGSINIRQAAKDLLNENLNATFVDAADIAEEQAANGTVISGHLSVLQGYLVYDVIVANIGNDTAYNVIVDPSIGRVLLTELIPAAGITTLIGSQAGKDFLGSGNATVTLVDAADVAEKQVPTGMAIAGSFEMSRSNPVYNVTVADIDKGLLFHITVDPRTGNMLTTPQGVPMSDLSIKDVF